MYRFYTKRGMNWHSLPLLAGADEAVAYLIVGLEM